ncbi:hypothetical protein HPB52_002834 [Rhipicephalus sanguineus]|uniref:5'-nucleotidase n=1 Tax=Rhipicephalus sanguineus TaxID=34632 RepID=A0A9D4PL70_RHISA|nr:hypothetical protein HPB52_002834 [Rhipicephalus sanguineus]
MKSKKQNVLFLNPGDYFQGTTWFSSMPTKDFSAIVSYMKHDAIGLGVHEFDRGTADLRIYLDAMRTQGVPVVLCNVDRLNKQGVHVIIALGHSGLEYDKRIAFEVPLVDIVVGGNSHYFMFSGSPLVHPPEPVYGPYPVIIQRPDGTQVGEPRHFYDKIFISKLAKSISTAREKADTDRNQAIGSTKVLLEGSRQKCRLEECSMGNLLTDALFNWYAGLLSEDDDLWGPVNGAILPGRDIYASIDERLTHGIRVEYNVRRQPYNRVTKLHTICTDCRVPKYVSVEANKTYRFVVPQTMFNGSETAVFDKLPKANILNTGSPHSISEDFSPSTRLARKKLAEFAKAKNKPIKLRYNKLVIDGVTYVYDEISESIIPRPS